MFGEERRLPAAFWSALGFIPQIALPASVCFPRLQQRGLGMLLGAFERFCRRRSAMEGVGVPGQSLLGHVKHGAWGHVPIQGRLAASNRLVGELRFDHVVYLLVVGDRPLVVGAGLVAVRDRLVVMRDRVVVARDRIVFVRDRLLVIRYCLVAMGHWHRWSTHVDELWVQHGGRMAVVPRVDGGRELHDVASTSAEGEVYETSRLGRISTRIHVTQGGVSVRWNHMTLGYVTFRAHVGLVWIPSRNYVKLG